MDHRSDPACQDSEKAQQEVIACLSDPDTHGGTTVQRIDTHISHVFIAGARSYKLKRAIRRNFLDYSTLERRRAACEREIEINRRTAPDLYLGTLPVTRTAGALCLGGEGAPVDWVVEMATFDPRLQFDRLVESSGLEPRHVIGLADVVADFHRRAPNAAGFGGAGAVNATIRQIAESIHGAAGRAEIASATDAWAGAAGARLAAHARRVDARRRHGCVRRCHGDLHLGNICLFKGRPTPFDAIEFSEAVASTDVLYDTAFAVMDLLHRGERALANLLLNRYLARARAYGGLGLMPLFVSMRAAVRAIPLVSLPRATGDAEALELLAFATAALDTRPEPFLVAVGGLSGSGKSTLAQALAPELAPGLGAIVLRADVARKVMAGVAPEERLPESAYDAESGRRVYTAVRRDAGRALRAGFPVVLDATFLDQAERDAAGRLAAREGVPFAGLWLEAPPERLGERLRRREGDASDATPELLGVQQRRGVAAEWTSLDAAPPLRDVLRHASAALADLRRV